MPANGRWDLIRRLNGQMPIVKSTIKCYAGFGLPVSAILTFWPRNYFFNFSTPCI